ncbi:MAG: hypothetical protein AB8C95_06325 [Phycisphaeraceae bacterium]
MKRTNDPTVRFCDTCLKNVHLAETEEQLVEMGKQGKCVAIDRQDCIELGLITPEDIRRIEEQE